MREHALSALLSLALALGAAACGSDETTSTTNRYATPPPPAANPGAPAPAPSPTVGNLRQTGIEVGRSVNPDNTMHDATVVFLPPNEVWVSVKIEGSAPHATLQVRWVTEGGEVLEKSSQEIAPTDTTFVAFHAKRPNGWTIGRYRVEVLLNDVALGSKDFEVREGPL
jgi:hypothetical protein